jgi:uncharacterized protein YkvS
MELHINEKTIARHKRYLILKQKKVAKRARIKSSGQSAVAEDEI